jgi:hypothetical protein
MINNSININKTNNYLSAQTSEQAKKKGTIYGVWNLGSDLIQYVFIGADGGYSQTLEPLYIE